ncbi:alpha-mannosidase I MNS4 isoform X2 [Amborella trichopoda]|uniref:alpha-mannosidase I MNS4 isoform X2 n=1 Tax=Amborella trichopoda TaxID=13333 RepID=UPI0009C18E7F|nr:alpha-mannosidase I MNS4 isoform X2 [Amborella trichopoda]|eukprot:XP_020519967.1 alpha-mannosidase I MNS4 isoform X2 [Amborella trichopoda]
MKGLICILILSTVFRPSDAEGVSPLEAKQLRDEVQQMFYHAFDGYMEHAFPLDELRPLTCSGEDSLGSYALTLIDSLDTLALLGDSSRFTAAVEWIGQNLSFDINKTVSLFETTIRVLGGLLSAHLIASDYATGMKVDSYDDQLLHVAEDLGQRLLPAFETPTGIPFGSVNLLYGVDEHESKITSTAGGGTLTIEFGVLSRLTGNPVFEKVTKNAVRGIWVRRSEIDLVGAHINVFTGEWTQKDAGIGTSIDSFYEYLLKAYLLFGDEEYLYMFQEAYRAVMHYLHNDPWYVEVNMNSAAVVWPLFNSLQAFWPGLQVLAGDVEPAARTHKAFFSVWKRYGFTPEGFNLATFSVQNGQKSYPLRPELIESTYWLFKATRDPMYLDAGRDMVASLQYGARCPCGYCHITDVESHKQEDHMESFFLAETVRVMLNICGFFLIWL